MIYNYVIIEYSAFSTLNIRPVHPGMLLKRSFRFSRSGVEPEILHFQELAGDANMASLQPHFESQGPGTIFEFIKKLPHFTLACLIPTIFIF